MQKRFNSRAADKGTSPEIPLLKLQDNRQMLPSPPLLAKTPQRFIRVFFNVAAVRKKKKKGHYLYRAATQTCKTWFWFPPQPGGTQTHIQSSASAPATSLHGARWSCHHHPSCSRRHLGTRRGGAYRTNCHQTRPPFTILYPRSFPAPRNGELTAPPSP